MGSCAALNEASVGQVSFFADHRQESALESTMASVVVVDEATEAKLSGVRFARLVRDNPAAGFAIALDALHPESEEPAGVHPSAVLEDGSVVHESASIGPFVYVGPKARVGARSRVMAGAYVGPGAVIGEDCVMGPRAVVMERCVLGNRVRLQPAAVIGSDGFGYVLDKLEDGTTFHRKVPQVGIVRIEDDVEIGAGACIDRATTHETIVGSGSKIDNLVQVGHNSVIGPLSILCGQVGLAGSTKLGRGVVMGGQSGAAGHLAVGDGAKAAAQAGITEDVPAGETVSGMPAISRVKWLRAVLVFKDLPALLKRVRRIEKKLGEG